MVPAIGPIAPVFAAFSLTASAAGVWLVIRVARNAGMLDMPNERSSHSSPVPRMGGVPMVAAAALAFLGWLSVSAGGNSPGKSLSYTWFFALSMFVLGFVDDLKGLSPLLRLLVQACFATWFLWDLAPDFPMFPRGGWGAWDMVGTAIAVVWTVWMLNLYNFMDGIDGLAGGEAAVASVFFFLLFAYYGEPGWAVANLVLAAASMGFLVHNWPPARVFMGDGGSAFLGAFYGMQSVVAPLSTPVPAPVLLLPFANFILDTTVTLFRRVLSGEKWYEAHRSHFYQRLTDLEMSHKQVTSLELLVAAVSCLTAGICLVVSVFVQIFLVALLVAGLAGSCFLIHGKERSLRSGRDKRY